MADHKLAACKAIEPAPLPQRAVFPLSQHIGAPAKPIVKKGDKVKVGTLLAEAGGFISAPVHSSVSGTVFKIDQAVDASGYQKPVIIVNVEGDDWEPYIDRSEKLERLSSHPELDAKEIVERVKTAGVTGMGGAGFPTYVKLMPPEGSVECVILNGVECEPYITSDHRLMLEHTAEIVEGLHVIMRAVGVKRGYIGIEVNKPDAIEMMEKVTADDDTIEVVPLKQAYPQGGEKQLIDAVINRRVPMPPAIPANVGAVVDNVATAFAVYQAVMKRKPLFERVVTVSGLAMKQSGNFLVRMGTSAASLIDLCGGLPEGSNKVLSGGPMMGKALTSLEAPIVKGSNAITVLTRAKKSSAPSALGNVPMMPLPLWPSAAGSRNSTSPRPSISAIRWLTPPRALSKFVWAAYRATPPRMASRTHRSTSVSSAMRFNPRKSNG